MEDLARVEARMSSLAELKGLFSAMQAMAASRVRAAQTSLSGVRNYTQTIEDAIRDAVALQPADGRLPPPSSRQATTHVVVCSEHGFVGAFNRRLLDRAKAGLRPRDVVVVVGRRGASIAAEHRLTATIVEPMAAHVDGILGAARRLASHLEGVDTVHVTHATYRGGNCFETQTRPILPPSPSLLTPRRTHGPPLHHLEAGVLLRRLIDELLLAELMLALTESFASENAARLAIMQAADQNIADKLDKLLLQGRQLRQDAITSELLDIVSGSEAVARLDQSAQTTTGGRFGNCCAATRLPP
jgi:F-type H+-transporting ATPase subunit gamma